MKTDFFDKIVFVGGAAFIGLAALDKVTEIAGWNTANKIVKVVMIGAVFVAAIIFIETNPILKWIGL